MEACADRVGFVRMGVTAPFNPLPPIPKHVTHQFRFHHSLHAVERFRERVKGDLSQLEQAELAMRMDNLIFASIASNTYKDVIDKDAPRETTKIVAVQTKKDETVHVVMRLYNPATMVKVFTAAGPSGAALLAITILTDEMAKESYSNGRWFLKVDVKTDPPAPTPQAQAQAQVKPTGILDMVASAKLPGDGDGAPYERELSDEESGGLGGTRKERADFVRAALKANPNVSMYTLAELAKKKFGVAVGPTLVNKIKHEIALETRPTIAPAKPAPAPIREPDMHGSRGWEKQVESRPTPPPAPAPAPAPTPPPTPVAPTTAVTNIAGQLALAFEQEKMAKARVESAKRELVAAEQGLASTSAQVTMLLEQLQAQRG